MESEAASSDMPTTPTHPRLRDVKTVWFSAIGIFILALESAEFGMLRKLFADFGGTLPGPGEFVFATGLPYVALSVSVVLALVAGLMHRSRNGRATGEALFRACALLAWLGAVVCALAYFLPFAMLSRGDRIM